MGFQKKKRDPTAVSEQEEDGAAPTGKKMAGTLDTTEADKSTPKSIIVYRGEVGNATRALMHEWRQVFLPWSSKRLHGENKSIRDFLVMAATLSVSHLQLFTSPSVGTSLRIMRFPSGPTLSFRVESFILRDDIVVTQRRPPNLDHTAWDTAPMVLLNNFNLPDNPREVRVMEETLQSLFPTTNVSTMKTSEIQRVMLFNYDPQTDTVEARHYYIQAKAVGLSKSVKKLLEGRVPTKLGQLDSIDEVLDREGAWSDTDGEGEEVPLASPFRRMRDQARIKLVEIGPRLTMTLMKIELGFAGGEVVFHRNVAKSAHQVRENAVKVRSRKNEKKKRKDQQDANVKAKRDRQQEKIDKRKSRRTEAEKQQRSNPLVEVGQDGWRMPAGGSGGVGEDK